MAERRGTIPFESLTEEICNSLPHVPVHDGRRTEITDQIEAKFQEEDVRLALEKYIEQRGRRPYLAEFLQFMNSWEGMPASKKSFAKLIDENITFRIENRNARNELRRTEIEQRDTYNRIERQMRDLEKKNRYLERQNNILLKVILFVLVIILWASYGRLVWANCC